MTQFETEKSDKQLTLGGHNDKGNIQDSDINFLLALHVAVTHFFAALSAVLMLIWILNFDALGGLGTKGYAQFNWHMLLSVLAWLLVLGEASIVYKTSKLEKRAAKTIHGTLQMLAFSLAIAAITVIFVNHAALNIRFFQTIHSWIGIAVFGTFCLQIISAVPLFWIQDLCSEQIKAKAIVFHRLAGKIVMIAAFATMLSGLVEKQRFLGSNRDAVFFGNFVGLSIIISEILFISHWL